MLRIVKVKNATILGGEPHFLDIALPYSAFFNEFLANLTTEIKR